MSRSTLPAGDPGEGRAIGESIDLITGITGFAGPWLARHLVEAGHRVAGLALNVAGHAGSLPDGVALHDGDIRDRDRLREVVRAVHPDVVYHLAALSHVGRSWEQRRDTLDVNVLGTGLLLEAVALEAPEAKVMLVSTGQVYGPVPAADNPLREERAMRPVSPYAASKACSEILARQATDAGDVEVSIARPFNFAGPGQHPAFVCSDFARQVARIEAGRQEPVIRVGNLDAERDFTDVRDMVRGFAAVARDGRPGRAYNLCSGRAVSIRELLEELLQMARCGIEVRTDPERMRPVDVPVFVGAGERAEQELGWKPSIPLRRTLADSLDAWRTAGDDER